MIPPVTRRLNSMFFVLIPQNILKLFNETNEPLESLLNLNRLLSILSREDVSFYLWCQYRVNGIFSNPPFKSIIDTISVFQTPDLLSSEIITNNKLLEYTDSRWMKYRNHIEISIRPFYDGLMCKTDKGNNIDEYMFEPVAVNEQCIGISLVPLTHIEDENKQLLYSYERLISLLRCYIPLTEIALTSVFKAFCCFAMA